MSLRKMPFNLPVALALLLVLIAGCASPEKHISKHMDGLRNSWETNLVRHTNLPVRRVDWPEALELMLQGNLKLRQARADVTNSIENYRQIFKELIPTLNGRAGVSKKLANLNSLSFDDVTFSADSFFNVPGLVNYSARIYVGKLTLIRSRTAYQLAEREQTVELFRLFNGVQEQLVELDKLTIQRANASAMTRIDPFTGRLMETELKTREIDALKVRRSLQQRASDIFGNYSYQWEFSTNGLPDLKYNVEPLPLTDTNRVAQLQMRLFALELEAARATLTGIKLRYWPELNIFISGPPVYQKFAGQSRWWDASQVRGEADLYWQLDTRGYVSRQLKQTKRAQSLERARYEQEALDLMDRLLFTQKLMASTQEQLNRTSRELQFLLATPPAQDFLAVQKYAQDYRSLTQQQIRLRRELSEFNSLFWFMDEQAWPKPTSIPLK